MEYRSRMARGGRKETISRRQSMEWVQRASMNLKGSLGCEGEIEVDSESKAVFAMVDVGRTSL